MESSKVKEIPPLYLRIHWCEECSWFPLHQVGSWCTLHEGLFHSNLSYRLSTHCLNVEGWLYMVPVQSFVSRWWYVRFSISRSPFELGVAQKKFEGSGSLLEGAGKRIPSLGKCVTTLRILNTNTWGVDRLQSKDIDIIVSQPKFLMSTPKSCFVFHPILVEVESTIQTTLYYCPTTTIRILVAVHLKIKDENIEGRVDQERQWDRTEDWDGKGYNDFVTPYITIKKVELFSRTIEGMFR